MQSVLRTGLRPAFVRTNPHCGRPRGEPQQHGPVLLNQLEIPLEIPLATLFAAASAATARGARFLLNPSPYQPVPGELLTLADPLIVNESEAAELSGVRIEEPVDAESAARQLLAISRSFVITIGGDGVVLAIAV